MFASCVCRLTRHSISKSSTGSLTLSRVLASIRSLGSDIAKVFHDAGLPWPSVKSVQYAAAGPDGPLWYYGDLLRTLMPNVERLGLATTDMVEIESLADRLSAEAEAKKTTAFLPRWVCAWARVS